MSGDALERLEQQMTKGSRDLSPVPWYSCLSCGGMWDIATGRNGWPLGKREQHRPDCALQIVLAAAREAARGEGEG